jgi:hypothetical protein
MSASESEPLGSLSGSEQQGDTSRSFQRQPVQTSIEASLAFGLREEQPFELPERLFQQLPFAVYVCDRDGLVLRYNRRAAELWGRTPKLGDPNERFCGSYRMFLRRVRTPPLYRLDSNGTDPPSANAARSMLVDGSRIASLSTSSDTIVIGFFAWSRSMRTARHAILLQCGLSAFGGKADMAQT